MAEVSKEELRRRIHVVLQTWTDEQDAGKPTFAPYDQWAACIEVLQSVEPLLARMAGPGEVVVQGWQPIETAPKDGTWIAAWRKHATRMRMLRWDSGYDAWEDDDGNHIYDVMYWMPLFARPNNGGNDDAA